MSFQGGLVATTGGAGLALPGIAVQATLGQPQDEVAQQIGWQSALAKQILRFGKHVVREVVGDGRSEMRRSTLFARNFGDLTFPSLRKEVCHGKAFCVRRFETPCLSLVILTGQQDGSRGWRRLTESAVRVGFSI